MKNRIRKVVNFFAFNLLFFALYLNFIHKDNSNAVANTGATGAAYQGTALVPQADAQPHDKAAVEVVKK